jgi:hypothetical protein
VGECTIILFVRGRLPNGNRIVEVPLGKVTRSALVNVVSNTEPKEICPQARFRRLQATQGVLY